MNILNVFARKNRKAAILALLVLILSMMAGAYVLVVTPAQAAIEGGSFKEYNGSRSAGPYFRFSFSDTQTVVNTYCCDLGTLGLGTYRRHVNRGSESVDVANKMKVSEETLSKIRHAVAATRVLYKNGKLDSTRIKNNVPNTSYSYGTDFTQNLIWYIQWKEHSNTFPSPMSKNKMRTAFDTATQDYFYGSGIGMNDKGTLTFGPSNPSRDDQGFYGPVSIQWGSGTAEAIKYINRGGTSRTEEPYFNVSAGGFQIYESDKSTRASQMQLGKNYYITFTNQTQNIQVKPAGTLIAGFSSESILVDVNVTSDGVTKRQSQYNLEVEEFTGGEIYFDSSEGLPETTAPTAPPTTAVPPEITPPVDGGNTTTSYNDPAIDPIITPENVDVEKKVTEYVDNFTTSLAGFFEDEITVPSDGKGLFRMKIKNNTSYPMDVLVAPPKYTGFIPIYTAAQLASIGVDAKYPLNGNYVLMNHIDLTEYSKKAPIIIKNFRGTFDGRGRLLQNYSVNVNSSEPTALFVTSSPSAVIKNVQLTQANVVNSGTGVTAALATGADISKGPTIENCNVTLSSSGKVQGGGDVGGVGGYISSAKGVEFNGSVYSTGSNDKYAAGIAAKSAGNIQNCSVSGTSIVSNGYAAGALGQAVGKSVTIQNCKVSISSINGIQIIGGIVASAVPGTSHAARSYLNVKNSRLDGTVLTLSAGGSGVTAVGGIVGGLGVQNGQVIAIDIKTCAFAGTISGASGTDAAGGILGVTYRAGSTDSFAYLDLRQCTSSGSITSSGSVGGLVGYAINGAPANYTLVKTSVNYTTNPPFIVEHCEANANVTVNGTGNALTTQMPGAGGAIGETINPNSSVNNNSHMNIEFLKVGGSVESTITAASGRAVAVGGIVGKVYVNNTIKISVDTNTPPGNPSGTKKTVSDGTVVRWNYTTAAVKSATKYGFIAGMVGHVMPTAYNTSSNSANSRVFIHRNVGQNASITVAQSYTNVTTDQNGSYGRIFSGTNSENPGSNNLSKYGLYVKGNNGSQNLTRYNTTVNTSRDGREPASATVNQYQNIGAYDSSPDGVYDRWSSSTTGNWTMVNISIPSASSITAYNSASQSSPNTGGLPAVGWGTSDMTTATGAETAIITDLYDGATTLSTADFLSSSGTGSSSVLRPSAAAAGGTVDYYYLTPALTEVRRYVNTVTVNEKEDSAAIDVQPDIKFHLQVFKFADTASIGTMVSGSEYKLYKYSSKTDFSGTETLVNTLEPVVPDGDIHRDLAPGYYVLKETRAPSDNFQVDTTHFYIHVTKTDISAFRDTAMTINCDLDLRFDSNETDLVAELSAVNLEKGKEDEGFHLYVEKYDGKTGSEITGSKFQLYKHVSDDEYDDSTMIEIGNPIYPGDASKEFLEALPAGRYTLKEIEAPAGYEIDENSYRINCSRSSSSPVITVTYVGTDGVEISSSDTKGESVTETTATGLKVTIKAKNQIEPVPLPDKTFILSKEDLAGASLAGAVYEVREYSADGSGKLLGEISSGSNLTVELDRLGGSFIINEKTAPEGYLLDVNKYIVEITRVSRESAQTDVSWRYVDPSGTAVSASDLKGSLSVSGNNLTLAAKDKPKAKLDVEKYDSLGTQIDGSEFQLKKSDNSQTITINPGAGGDPIVLEPGSTYYLTETSAPAGYIKDKNRYAITTDNAGNASALYENTSGSGMGGEITFVDGILKIKAKNMTKRTVTVDKYDKDDLDKFLSGAEFALYQGSEATGTPIATIKPGVENENLYNALEPGTYILKETKAPEGYGYDKNMVYRIDVAENGTITAKYQTAAGVAADNETQSQMIEINGDQLIIKAQNVKMKTLKVEKYTQSGTDKISGAEFVLYQDNGASGETIADIKPGTDENFAVINIGTYFLKEVKAPSGYAIDSNEFKIVVTESGITAQYVDSDGNPTSIPWNGDDMIEIDGDQITIKARNKEYSKVTVEKYAQDGTTALSGASYNVYSGTSAEGTPIAVIRPGVDGADFAQLGEGTYTMKEVVAPGGYYADTNTYTLVVTSSGVITATYNYSSGANLSGEIVGNSSDNVVIKAKNAIDNTTMGDWSLVIEKYDSTGTKALGDSAFDIYDGTTYLTTIYPGTSNNKYTLPVPTSYASATKTYKAYEKTAPSGYVLDSASYYSITVTKKTFAAATLGAVTFVDGGSGIEGEIVTDGKKITIKARNAYDGAPKLKLEKYSVKDKGLELPEAVYSLYSGTSASGEPIGTIQHGGEIELPGVGTYTLKETTAPEGYALDDNMYRIVVSHEDGTATVKYVNAAGVEQSSSPTSGNVSFGQGTITIKALDQIKVQSNLTLVKQDLKGNTLTGAVYEVRKYVSGGTGDLAGELTDADELSLILGKYVIQEKTAPSGYMLDPNKYILEITEGSPNANISWKYVDADENEITPATKGSIAQSGDAIVLTAKDKPKPKLNVEKYDETGLVKLPAGAEFVLSVTRNGSGISINPNSGEDPAILEAGTYFLRETTAPEGYMKDVNAYIIVVAEDGSVSVSYDAEVANGLEGNVSSNADGVTTIKAKNMVKRTAKVEKYDVDDSTALSGSKFEIYTGESASGNPMATIRPGETGQDEVKLDPGVYTLKEAEAPSQYVFDSNMVYRITVDNTGAITAVYQDVNGTAASNATQSQVISINGSSLTIKAQNLKSRTLTVAKYDEGGSSGLTNSEFALYSGNRAEGTPIATLKPQTMQDSYTLTPGVYTLKETVAPTGFMPDSNMFIITVDWSGSITASYTDENGDPADSSWTAAQLIETDGSEILIKARNEEKKRVTVGKYDEDGNSTLTGAEYEVYSGESAQGEPIGTIRPGVSDENSLKLEYGAYTLKEKTAPTGFVKDSNLYRININADGTMSAVYVNSEGVEQNTLLKGTVLQDADGKGITINARDLKKRTIEIEKYNEDGTTALTGAEYELFANAIGEGTAVATLKPGVNGQNSFQAEPGTYSLKEKTAPEGYMLDSNFYVITVSETGVITTKYVNSSGTEIGGGLKGEITIAGSNKSVLIKAKDMAKRRVTVEKYNEDASQALTGAEYELFSGNNVSGTAVATINPGVSGQDYASLDAGTYTLKEKTAPSDYLKDSNVYRITVTDSGEISAKYVNAYGVEQTGGLAGEIVEVEGGLCIKAKNAPTPDAPIIKLKKTNASGNKNLGGAAFLLTKESKLGDIDPEPTIVPAEGIEFELELGQDYVLEEITPPTGYAKTSRKYYITSDMISGTVYFSASPALTDEDEVQINGNIVEITVRNSWDEDNVPAKLKVEKYDAEDKTNALTGAEFSLYAGETASGTVVKTFKPGVAGEFEHVLDPGVYTLKETAAPSGGYNLDENMYRIIVDADGTITAQYVDADGNAVDSAATKGDIASMSEGILIKAYNQSGDFTSHNLKVEKYGFDGTTALSGSEFSVYKYDSNVKGALVATIKPGDATGDKISLAPGKYIMNETKAPQIGSGSSAEPYSKDAMNYIIIVNNAGIAVEPESDIYDDENHPLHPTITVVDDNDGSRLATLKAKNRRPSLKIEKTDLKGAPLTGFEFSLQKFEGETVYEDIIASGGSDKVFSNGTAIIVHDLENGSYKLKETSAPQGYELDETEHIIHVSNDEITFVSGHDSDHPLAPTATVSDETYNDGWEYAAGTDGVDRSIVIKAKNAMPAKAELVISKEIVNEDGDDPTLEDYRANNINPTKSYTFNVMIENMETNKKYYGKIQDNGSVKFSDIPFGDYLIHEMSSDPFRLSGVKLDSSKGLANAELVSMGKYYAVKFTDRYEEDHFAAIKIVNKLGPKNPGQQDQGINSFRFDTTALT